MADLDARKVYNWTLKGKSDDPKHRGFWHPFVVSILVILINRTMLVLGASALESVGIRQHHPVWLPGGETYILLIGKLLLLYWAVILAVRLFLHGGTQLYDSLWACTAVLLWAADGCLTNRPDFVGTALCVVTIDHWIFLVDLVGYSISGKFLTGSAAYLAWPETTLFKKISSTHHLWYMPLCWFILEKWGGGCFWNYWLQALFAVVSIVFGARLFVPRDIINASNDPKAKGKMVPHYMNINLTYECWKDSHFIPGLHRFDMREWYISSTWCVFWWMLFTLGLYAPFYLLHWVLKYG